MPLSEDEQRILQDIERSFYESDPAFARAVTKGTVSRHAGRNCKLAIAGFLVSFAVMVFTFTHILLVGFVGFAGMVLCATVFVHNLRRLGERVGRGDGSSGETTLDQLIQRLRDRLHGE